MENREAIKILSGVSKYADKVYREALTLAIAALEKQEQDRWIPVIRCDDCKYYGSRRWCELHSSVFDDNAFCSYGERKD